PLAPVSPFGPSRPLGALRSNRAGCTGRPVQAERTAGAVGPAGPLSPCGPCGPVGPALASGSACDADHVRLKAEHSVAAHILGGHCPGVGGTGVALGECRLAAGRDLATA